MECWHLLEVVSRILQQTGSTHEVNILELLVMLNTSSLVLLPGHFCRGVIVPVKVISMGQIELVS